MLPPMLRMYLFEFLSFGFVSVFAHEEKSFLFQKGKLHVKQVHANSVCAVLILFLWIFYFLFLIF